MPGYNPAVGRAAWVAGTGRGTSANPLFQGPLISRRKRDNIKASVNNFTGGVKDFFGGNKNPYQSAETSVPSIAPEIDPGVFDTGKKSLQSSAKTRRISGGTRAERKEARSLATDGPNTDALASGATAVAGLGIAALDAIDKDPGYGGADAGKAALQGAAMGANPALVAATGGLSIVAGAVVGGTIGLIKKKKYEKEERKKKRKENQKLKDDRMKNRNVEEAQNFFAGQSAANQAAYTGQDIDMFINKYAQ